MKVHQHIFLLFIPLFISCSLGAKDREGVDKKVTQEDIVANVHEFLHVIDCANYLNEPLDWGKVRITTEAIQEFEELWAVCPFSWEYENLKGRLTYFHTFWHTRALTLQMQPTEQNRKDEFLERELVLKMDTTGLILSVCISISIEDFEWCKTRAWPEDANDIYNRMQIINYVEYLYTAFHRNDIDFIKDFFGYNFIDAPKKPELFIFLNRLIDAMSEKQWVNMYADKFLIARIRTQKDLNNYSVRFAIHCQTSEWKEDAFVDMEWNFKNPERPEIRSLKWVPQESVKGTISYDMENFKLEVPQ